MKRFFYLTCFFLTVTACNEKSINLKNNEIKNTDILKEDIFYQKITGDIILKVKKDSMTNILIGEAYDIEENTLELDCKFKKGDNFYYVHELSKERVEILNIIIFDTLFSSKYLIMIEPFSFPKEQNIYCMKYRNDSLYFLEVYSQNSLNFELLNNNFMERETVISLVNHLDSLTVNHDIIVEQNVKGNYFYKLSWVNIFKPWYFISYRYKNGEKAFSDLQGYRSKLS